MSWHSDAQVEFSWAPPEDDLELSELSPAEEEQLDIEIEETREAVLEMLRELLDDYLNGDESLEETEAELLEDLQDWQEEEASFRFADFPELSEAWQNSTASITEGYQLMLMGLELDQPEFLQEGYLMVEEGLFGRDQVLNGSLAQ